VTYRMRSVLDSVGEFGAAAAASRGDGRAGGWGVRVALVVGQFPGSIRELLENDALYSAVAVAGRSRVEAHHDIDNLNDRLVRVLTGQLACSDEVEA
jgi:hypothetical protein